MFRFFESRLDPFPSAKRGSPPTDFFGFVWFYSRDAAPWLIAMTLLTAAVAVGEVFLFDFLGRIVDWLATADRERFLEEQASTLWGMGALLLVGLPVAVMAHSFIVHQVLLGNMPMSGRWLMHGQLLGQSMAFFSNEFAGRIATKVMQTALSVREAVTKVLDIFVFVIIYFVTMVSLVAAADPRLALPMVIWLAVYVAINAWFVPRLSRVSARQADARSLMTGRIVDSYTNISTVKLFAHAGHEEDYARESMDGFLQTVYPQMRLVTVLEGIVYLNNSLLVFFLAVVGISLWLGELVTVGALATAIAMSMRLKSIAQWIMWEVAALFEHVGVIYDGIGMLSKPVAVQDAADALVLPRCDGAIAFDEVTFHYGKNAGVFSDLSLEVSAGEKVGLVGRSGAGKTTLTSLLLRFYDVEGGRVTVDGHDVRAVSQDSLRAQIGVVSQDTSLLHRSIRENIAYGKPDATDEMIVDAVRRANALEFIEGLEDSKGRSGFDAHVGERGVKLSGGQRQRIAIARIFLKDAPILILDEATSALDSEAELAIQDHLFELMEGKTVIAIAHRLSTIAAMDRLIVLDRGAILEEGSHEALVAQGGLYADLWAHQSGGFLTQPKLAAAK
ncbi:MAG: ABC transporter ATP-binding protein [Myxococcota bacterium]